MGGAVDEDPDERLSRTIRFADLARDLGVDLPPFRGPLVAFAQRTGRSRGYLGGDLHAVHPGAREPDVSQGRDESLDRATITLLDGEGWLAKIPVIGGVWCTCLEGAPLGCALFLDHRFRGAHTHLADPAAVDAAVAICGETLARNPDWPMARFTLHQLVELGSRASDGFRVAALNHGLASSTAPHLAISDSFGVRARAFVVLARIGHLSGEMFDALVGGALDINEVSAQIFGSLRLIRSVDDTVVERIGRSLGTEGVEAIAALDAARQLLHSYVLDGDSTRRHELVVLLVNATSACSPWAVCRLPSGLGVLMQSLMAQAVLMTNTDQVGEVRPIMLTVPRTRTAQRSTADAKRGFTEQFLELARRHLEGARSNNDQNR